MRTPGGRPICCSSRMGLTGPISRCGQATRRGRLLVGPAGIVRPIRGCVIMASYNERSAIVPVLAEIDEAARALASSGIELSVLLVDDLSPDGTAGVAAGVAKQLGLDFSVLQGDRHGVGHTILRGFAHALADPDLDFLVTLDADGQHDGRQIPDLVRANLGSRQRDDDRLALDRAVAPRPARAGTATALSRTGNTMVRGVTGLRGVHDATTSFRVYTREVAQLLRPEALRVEGYGFLATRSSPSPVRTAADRRGADHLARPRYQRDGQAHPHGHGRLHPQPADGAPPGAARSGVAGAPTRPSGSSGGRATVAGRPAESTFGAAEELHNLASADRFLDWMHSEVAPYLGDRVVEVGAGLGSMTRRLAGGGWRGRRVRACRQPVRRSRRAHGRPANVVALQQTSQQLLPAARRHLRLCGLRQRARAHPRRRRRAADRPRAARSRRRPGHLRTGDGCAVRQPGLQVRSLPALRQGAPAFGGRAGGLRHRPAALPRGRRRRAVLGAVPAAQPGVARPAVRRSCSTR